MPTEYLKYAIDGDGDGKIDIWRSVPDALAFTAKQLEGKGWVRGERWGYEVIAPPHADCSLEGPPDARPVGDWLKMGFRKACRSSVQARPTRGRRLSDDAGGAPMVQRFWHCRTSALSGSTTRLTFTHFSSVISATESAAKEIS